MQYTFSEIPIEKLLLDVNNPRHDILESQPDAVREMIVDQHDKLVNLARDIVERGINPSELTIVTPDIDKPDKFIVLEGNRRVAALMLLTKPSLSDLGEKPTVAAFFKEQGRIFANNPIATLRCVVFANRSDATHWIELKHTGENQGVGVVRWDSEAVARFRQRQGKPSLALQVVEFVKKNAKLDESQKTSLDNIRLTNVTRLVNDPDVRDALGITVDGGDVVSQIPPEEVMKGLTKIVTDIANKDFTVNDIRHKKDRADYLQGFSKNELPNKAGRSIEPWRLDAVPADMEVTPAPTAKPAKRSVPLSVNRRTLIPAKCTLRIEQKRVNKIYRELRGMSVDDFPNASAVLLRVFLELSLEEYARINHIAFPPQAHFARKLQLVADYFLQKKIMTDAELKPIRVAYSSQHHLFSAHTLHAYVHNKDFSPKSRELKETWDGMQPFLEAMWP